MKKTIALFLLVLSIFISQFLLPKTACLANNTVYANTQDVEKDLSEYLKIGTGQKLSNRFDTPASMVNLLVRVIFVGVGLILLVMIIVAGLAMIAGETSDSKGKAKTTMTSALMGFLVIFAAYWILQIIQIFTGANFGF